MKINRKAFGIFGFLFLFLATTISSQAQESNEKDSSQSFSPQLTFVYPLGTNGKESVKIPVNLSLNILFGINGGLNGAEFGVLGNVQTGKVSGAQFAGLTNINTGQTHGAQFAGIANLNIDTLTGFQGAGIINVNTSSMRGTQLAGIANASIGDIKGGQFAGIANVGTGNVNGVQAAGIINVNADTTNGAQLAAILNYTKTLKGLQLGLINISDTVASGVPIGLITIVAKGYRRLEVEASESLYATINFKTGTHKFYNIFSVGFRPENQLYWGVGYGFGTWIPLSEKFALNIDASAHHINIDEWWTNQLNLLSKLKINLGWRLTDRLEMFGGPSYNIMVSQVQNPDGTSIGSTLAPYTFYDRVHNGTHVTMWIGLNAGIRF